MTEIHILFDGPPGPESGRFVEVEDAHGRSIRFGEWQQRGAGIWALVFEHHPAAPELLATLKEIRRWCIPGMNWTDEIGQALLDLADAAIAKAEDRE